MHAEEQKFVRLDLEEIEFGRPLRSDIYDGNRQVLLKKGDVVATRAEAEDLYLRGAYRALRDTADTDAAVNRTKVALAAEPAATRGQAVAASEYTLESSRIRIGDPVILQASADSPKYTPRLIGYLKNRGVVVTQPEVNGELVILREATALTVRFFSGKSVYEFKTTVLKQTNIPYPMLHLAYPRELRVQEVRRSPRVPAELITAIEYGEPGRQVAGKIIDLGTAGAGVCGRTRFAEQGAAIKLKFKLKIQGIEVFFVIDAEIRNVARREDGDMPFLYGLRFVDVDPTMQLGLLAFVYGHQLGDL